MADSMKLNSERFALTTDVVIVGGGIVGRAVALDLARHSFDVVLIDTTIPEHRSASQAAGAMLGAFGEVTAQDEFPRLDVDLAARVKAADVYEAWLESLSNHGPAPSLRPGTLIVASAANRQDRSNLKAIVAALASYSRRHESVDTDDLPYINPASERPITEAIFLPDESSVNIPELMASLKGELQIHSHVTILAEAALQLLGPEDRVTGVATTASVVHAKWVVLAAGVHTTALLSTHPSTGLVMPRLLEGKGTSIVLEAVDELPNVVRTPNREFSCGLHLVPRGRSTVYLGATNRAASVIGASGGATASEVHYLLDSAIHEMDTRLARADVISVTAGSRPISPDRRPLFGITDLPGLAVATATYRNGVLLAPYVGHVLTGEITNGLVSSDNCFTPVGRVEQIAMASIQTARKVLEGASSDLLSMFIEPRGSLPYGRDQEFIRLFELLVSLINDSQDPAIQDLCACTIDMFPIEEIVPELMYRFLSASPRKPHARD
jgi:glycine oxidase